MKDDIVADINIMLDVSAKGKLMNYTIYKYSNCKRIRQGEALDSINKIANCPKCMNQLIIKVYVPDRSMKAEAVEYLEQAKEEVDEDDGEMLLTNVKEEFVEIKEAGEFLDEVVEMSDEEVHNEYIDTENLMEVEQAETEEVEEEGEPEAEAEEVEPDQSQYEGVEYLYEELPEMKIEQDKDVWECEVCSERYASKLSLAAHKRKHPELRLPTYCKICDRDFEKGHFWKKHHEVYHSDAPKPRKIKKRAQNCGICGLECGTISDIKAHIQEMHADMPKYECAHCPKSYYTKKHVRDHILRKHFGRESRYICGACDPPKDLLTKVKLEIHIANVHSAKEVQEKGKQKLKESFKKEWRNENGEFNCPRCMRVFTNRFSLRIHHSHCIRRKEPLGATPTCHICHKVYGNWHRVKVHIHDIHERRYRFVCQLCGQGFSQKKHWLEHLELHNYDDPKPYKCNMCGKGFKHKQHISKHMVLKHEPVEIRPFVCSVCQPEKRFVSLGSLNHHDKMVHAERNLACPHCPLKFKNEQQRKGHIRYMHIPISEKPKFTCDTCGYVTTVKASLTSHQLQHAPVKPFPCNVCSKGFVTADLLKRHQLIHSNARPHECKVCHKRFRHRADLTTHMRLHTGEKPYECQVCGKRYSDRGCFRSHLVTHEKQLNIVLDKSTKKSADQHAQAILMKQDYSELIEEEVVMS